MAVSTGSCFQIRHVASDGPDLGLPLRGQTALYLSVILGKSDVTRELLREMMKTRSVARNINIFSEDNACRSVNRIAKLYLTSLMFNHNCFEKVKVIRICLISIYTYI